MSVNQCQDPTPEQEAMYAKDCEIDYLKEQLAEAVRLLNEVHSEYYLLDPSGETEASIVAFLDQNQTK